MERRENIFRNNSAFQTQLNYWFEMSTRLVESEKTIALQRSDTNYLAKLSDEIALRKDIRNKYKDHFRIFPNVDLIKRLPPPSNIIGTFSVLGVNPGTPENEIKGYFGKISITKQVGHYDVEWNIESTQPIQVLYGKGLLVNNIFSVVFQGPDGISHNDFSGLAVYEMICDEILIGTWTGLEVGIVGKELLRKVI